MPSTWWGLVGEAIGYNEMITRQAHHGGSSAARCLARRISPDCPTLRRRAGAANRSAIRPVLPPRPPRCSGGHQGVIVLIPAIFILGGWIALLYLEHASDAARQDGRFPIGKETLPLNNPPDPGLLRQSCASLSCWR